MNKTKTGICTGIYEKIVGNVVWCKQDRPKKSQNKSYMMTYVWMVVVVKHQSLLLSNLSLCKYYINSNIHIQSITQDIHIQHNTCLMSIDTPYTYTPFGCVGLMIIAPHNLKITKERLFPAQTD